MKKVDISMEEERDGSFQLAENLYNSGVRPTFIYGVTRGGNYVAGPVSEYFKWRYSKENLGLKLITGSVVAHEYSNENRPGEVIVEGWAPALSRISENDTMVLCDDCYDSGNTLKALVKDVELHTSLRKEFSPLLIFAGLLGNCNLYNAEPIEIGFDKIVPFKNRQLIVVTHDLKFFYGQGPENLRFIPDAAVNIFHCEGKWEDGNGPWIQYGRYEMMGLTDEEIYKRYKVKA